jgi:hypothetical protein
VGRPVRRSNGILLAGFPRLLNATPPQRLRYEISAEGLRWEDLDEDISVPGLLTGRGDQTKPAAVAAE